MDDSELLQRYVLHRSEAAFTELVNRHLDMVFSAACRQVGGDVHRAQDVAQLVFADLARKAPALIGHTALVGWLYTSTHFAAAKVRRSEQRRAEREREAHAMNELLSAPADHADWEQLRPVLDEAMLELKPRDRSAVLLRFFEQRSFADVGRHLGLGENAARMSVERALEKLRGLLARRGITSTSVALSLTLSHQAVTAAPMGLASVVATGALAQTLAGSAGLGVVVTSFMANIKVTVAVATLAALLTIGTGVVTKIRARRAAAEIDGLTQATAALTARALRIETRLATLGQIKPHSEEQKGTPTATEPATAKSDELARAMLTDPQSLRLLAQLYRLDAGRNYAALYGQLGWTAVQIAEFESIVQASSAEDLRSQGGAQVKGGVLSLTPEIIAQRERIRSEFEHRVRGTFGDAALQQFLTFERTSAARAVADEIARRVYWSATPLTAAQAGELVRILEAVTPASDHGRPVSQRAVDWAQAQGVLAPVQLAVLRAIQLKAELEAKRSAMLSPELKQ